MAEGPRPAARVRSVNCPNCGAATMVRTFAHAVSVVCQNCNSILDAKDEGVTIIQKYKDAVRYEPAIPLGSRGKIKDVLYEVVGFQVRQVTVDGTNYQWREYLLFNPFHGFRYLTEYGGHWNMVTTLRALPDGDPEPGSSLPKEYDGRTFKHFQTAEATTVFVLGEFPWEVRVGDKVTAADYVSPPYILSGEMTADKEVTWSLGEYTLGKDVHDMFSLTTALPDAEGVFANQPNPYRARARGMWRSALVLMAIATVLWLGHLATSRAKAAFVRDFTFDPGIVTDASMVTPIFELDGRPSAVRVDTLANVDNNWMYVNYALINNDTGQAYDFGSEVSYYHGVEDGESWSEGSTRESVTLPEIPPGHYFLRIEPEGERNGRLVAYRVAVVRDVGTSLWYLIAMVLLIVPPIRASLRAGGFETRRWAESDHPVGGSSSSSDDDDDDSDDDSGSDNDD